MRRNSTRLHPDAVGMSSAHAFYDTDGAVNIAVPDGSSGVMLQAHYNKEIPNTSVYWDFHEVNTPMTASDQGFALPGNNEVLLFWFDPNEITYFNFWLQSAAELMIKWIHPPRPI